MSTSVQSYTNPDGSITGIVASAMEPLRNFGLLQITVPLEITPEQIAGRYFLVRCGVNNVDERDPWNIYFRRPLFLTDYQPQPRKDNEPIGGLLTTLIPYRPFIAWADLTQRSEGETRPADPGYDWLARVPEAGQVNLLGPFGNGFMLAQSSRNLLLTATGDRIATLLPLIEPMLNRHGRVTLLIRTNSEKERKKLQAALVPRLPIAVELQIVEGTLGWQTQLQEMLRWADQLCAALPEDDYASLAMQIREKRFHIEEGFAQILVDADLLCGVGACLACVIPTAGGGHTRACANGPVFDLVRLVRRNS